MQEDADVEDQKNGKDLEIQKKIKSNLKNSFRKSCAVKQINTITLFNFRAEINDFVMQIFAAMCKVTQNCKFPILDYPFP